LVYVWAAYKLIVQFPIRNQNASVFLKASDGKSSNSGLPGLVDNLLKENTP